MAETLWYFGYGSNMNPEIFQGRRGLSPAATVRALLEGYRLCFDIAVGPGERGVANLEAVATASTWGVAYLLTTTEADHLDRTEGVHVGIYSRNPVEIALDGGERVPAFTYRSDRTTTGRKPSPRYIGLLLDGARAHGLPAEYVRFLEGFELAVDERVPEGG
jgi:gamma-glutamylcyclotransferase